MSGIFKGDSIYKSGGGGGGYKDGGQLIDGDFIKVENNAVSTYDNESRDPVNFYFELKDGEILNSVIEFTTQVNATVNVYILKNGFYYLLGNIGGNTVNAGDDYNINIIGKSYSLDPVTPPPTVPEYADIMGGIYGVAKVGNRLWLKENFTGIIQGVQYKAENNTVYYKCNSSQLKTFNENGWKLPRYADVSDLISYYNANQLKRPATPYSSWNDYAVGNNDVTFYPYGYGTPDIQQIGDVAAITIINDNSSTFWSAWSLYYSNPDPTQFNPHSVYGYCNIRLVKQL